MTDQRNNPIKICMAGAYGRMGRRILELAEADDAFEVAGAFDRPDLEGTELLIGAEGEQPQTITLAASAEGLVEHADVLIDFTQVEVCLANVEAAAAVGKPSVIGTTGISEEHLEQIKERAHVVPIVLAPNMSVGVNLLFKLTSEVAEVLGLDYNVEIIETHHRKKKDSPSGTAVRLAERVAGALGLDYGRHVAHGREGIVGERPVKEIGMHAMRGGDVVGEHTVRYVGDGETLELTHKAHNRDNFARGALIAARFTQDAKPGLYDMQDVLGLT